jgi:Uma2 family endonuclease
VNVSDREEDWKANYRIPDGAFFSVDNPARDCGTFWYRGPDLAIEIVSPGDRAREKFDFYGSVGTRELLLIDRQPWQLELYASAPGGFELQHTSRPGDDVRIELQTLPISLTLKEESPRPRILVECRQLAVSEFV